MHYGTPTLYLTQWFRRLVCPEEDLAISWETSIMTLMHYEDGKFFKERDGEMCNNLLMNYGVKTIV
jgi:hypothetical protein